MRITCKCGQKHCEDEMRVEFVRIEGKPSAMLHVARKWEFGSTGVTTVCLDARDRAELIEALSHPELLP